MFNINQNMAAESDGNSVDGEIFSLREFTECFDLPMWVEVLGGRDAGPAQVRPCNIQKGMILMLRTLAVENVTLSFNDTDTGMKRMVQVSPDSQVKFKVLLPFPDFKNPLGPKTVYPTVFDLLKVCPTYFKANVFYDDPYLPAIVKSGEVFRFIRQIKHTCDRRQYLQCEDADGSIIELPAECRGDFTAVEDHKSYSLKEILELGPLDRKLKLSRDHIKMSLIDEPESSSASEAIYSNLTHSEGRNVLQRILGLPLTYTGMLSLHKPVMFLAASPSDRLQEVWKIPIDLDVNVKQFVVQDYEKPTSRLDAPSPVSPVCKMFKLSELLDTFHEDFPVLATLVHYKDAPVEFKQCLEPGCDVIIHNIERYDRILAKSGDTYFTIGKGLNGRFRKTLRKLHSIEDVRLLYSNGDELMVKILQDVASDFPVPFSLHTGDVLRFKTVQTKMHKVKLKSKSFGPYSVVQCEKRKENGGYAKLILPDDLELCMHEMPSRSKAEGFSADDVFRFKPELPFRVDYLADYTSLWSCLPICSEIELTNFVTEPFALISPVSNVENSKHIDYKVRDCLMVPARHHMMLTVKECLGFPPGYFMFPDRNLYISTEVEKISKQSFDELIRHNDMAYEDYGPESPNSTSSDIQLPIRNQTSARDSNDAINKRLSRSLSNMLKTKPSNIFKKLKRKKSGDKPVSLAVGNVTYQPGSEISASTSEEQYDDDNIYESVNIKGSSDTNS